MKYHIVSPIDNIDKIINTYKISFNKLKKDNPNIDLIHLKIGDKILINEETKITIKQTDEYQKYICPHCKNVILIPK